MQHFVYCSVLDSHEQHAGRALLRSVHAPLRHDLYCAVLGAYAMWGAAAATIRMHGLVQRTRGGRAMLTELQGWLLTLARLGLLAFLTLVVIPFMAGLLLDLVMLPFRRVCCHAYRRRPPCSLCMGILCLSGEACVLASNQGFSLVPASASVCFAQVAFAFPNQEQSSRIIS